ncbi:hypothetical protein C8A00DRAFT_30524 [Chaetomidium leptoderma]|uniref:Uncharacterized protein n=1 Tax=Chaetomidium leptoderma TaxID=669021 RepID=A0AAN6VRP0_9PEZI|nr:hypothetical protein C8A00DRAFT_30524 [Chaetomidium leptoderma]
MSNQGNSHVGAGGLYEAQDQRRHSQTDVEELTRQSGTNVMGFMPKDQAGEVNRLHMEEIQRRQAQKMKDDPTYPAMRHGNKPNKGAIIDKELQEEDEAMLQKKRSGDSMPGKKF